MSFVSANLAYVRRQLGLSQAELAEQLSIKRSLLGAYEEARATPRYDVLEKLSELSGHSVSDLLNRRLVPDGYQAPTRRGRLPGSKNRAAESLPAAMPQASLPVMQAPTVQGPATLTLTVDTSGQPLATLVSQAEQSRYGSQSHQASYIAALPTLSIPMLDRQQAYRAFEMEPGFIHIGKLVRNWGTVGSSDSLFLLVYKKQVLPAHATAAGPRGISWSFPSGQRPPAGEEPLEIWESEWVLTRRWEPLPQQLERISERLGAIEELLGR